MRIYIITTVVVFITSWTVILCLYHAADYLIVAAVHTHTHTLIQRCIDRFGSLLEEEEGFWAIFER